MKTLLVAGCVALAMPAAGALPEGEISGARAKETVRLIASFGPRPAGGTGAEARVAKLVAGRFRELGYRVVVQRVGLPSGRESQNVVALSEGLLRALVVAHLDGVHGSPAANDNASGVAVLLELARALRETEGVLFVATGAEERVVTGSSLHLGSKRLLRGISAAGKRRIGVALVLDMVGVGGSLHVRGLEATPNRSAALTLARARVLRLRATYLRDDGDSDHAELTRAGLPAAWIQWRPDPCWHSACDRAERVDPANLDAAGELALAAVRAALASR